MMNQKDNKRIIVVLGMHRSGTSAITRGLQTLGVELGDKLMPPSKDNNEKGFFEDLDVNELDIALLKELGHDWYSLTPLSTEEFNGPIARKFKLQAVELLRRKLDSTTLFGMKDPRFARLLPFWIDVIEHLQIKASYIVACRHPRSVAKSLAKRDGFDLEKGYYLWLDYMLSSLNYTTGLSRIVVDYDALIAEPVNQLQRIANYTGLTFDPTTMEFKEYKEEFLDNSMRHTHYAFDDLHLDIAAPPVMVKLYRLLYDLARDKLTFDNPRFQSLLNDINKKFEVMSHLLTYQRVCDDKVTNLEIELLKSNNQILGLNQVVIERDSAFQALSAQLVEKEQGIQALSAQLMEKEQGIQALSAQLVEKEQGIQALSAQLVEKEQEVRVLTAQVSEKTQKVDAYIAWIASKDQLIQTLSEEERAIKSSTGWSIIQFLWRIRLFLAPHGSTRERIGHLTMKGLHVWRSQGFSVFLRKVYLKLNPFKGQVQNEESQFAGNVNPDDNEAHHYRAVYLDTLQTVQNKLANDFIPLTEKSVNLQNNPLKLIAFYLPQFHPFPENDQWWGKGFTEWTNVSKAIPQFVGHYQPHLPGELGFYDLRVPDVQRRQVELAKQYGLSGFCFYFYWFNGKRLLERPLDQFVSDPEIDLPFCLCWANENWTRRWDGLESDILISQEHSAESDMAFIRDIEPFLKHKNYIKVNGKPLLLVYRTQLMPDPAGAAERWRKYCEESGIGDLYLVASQAFGMVDPREIGFDAAIEFPPNGLSINDITTSMRILNPAYSGRIYRYGDAVEQMIRVPTPPYQLFKTIFPGWDNEPRKPGRGNSFAFSSPGLYKRWLIEACRFTLRDPDPDKRLVFINAWNEWGEGAHLEPDRKYGYAYLQATADALRLLFETESAPAVLAQTVKRHDTAVILHLFYPELWEEYCGFLSNLDGDFDLFVTIPNSVDFSDELIYAQFPQATIHRCENRGRDIAPFLTVFSMIYPLRYQYICKIHTKRSTHRQDGERWRQDMLAKLLGSREQIALVKHALDEIPDLGILAPQGHVVPGTFYWGSNAKNVENLARQAGILYEGAFSFAAGSMFWFRPETLGPITSMSISKQDFEPEEGQVDGTLAHAFERFFGLLALRKGYKLAELSQEGVSMVPDTSVGLDYDFAAPTDAQGKIIQDISKDLPKTDDASLG
jgi:lipopolysaccharide biosynthesis protein/predicted  nucleic acid-binding Zn-ribbon protein